MSGIIDCEMHIGDEVFVHGYIDEIRNDTIIIRNVGGYFGTSRDEVFYYEEDRNGYGTMNTADTPQTDLSAEEFVEGMKNLKMEVKQTNCDTCRHYKLACELFSEICKYEPITQTETQNSNLTFEIDTPQTEEDRLREQCRAFIDMVEITKGADTNCTE